MSDPLTGHEAPEQDDYDEGSLEEMKETRHRTEIIFLLARKKTKAIIDKAEQKAKLIREKAHQEGHEKGHAEGLAAGRAEGLKKIMEKGKALMEEMERINQEHKNSLEGLMENLESRIREVVMESIKRILHREIEQDKELIIRNIQKAAEKVIGRDAAKLLIHKDNLQEVLTRKSELLMDMEAITDLDIIPGKEIDPVGCIIETPQGIVDARLGSQMEVLGEIIKLS